MGCERPFWDNTCKPQSIFVLQPYSQPHVPASPNITKHHFEETEIISPRYFIPVMENLQDLVESLPETEVSPLHNTPAPTPYKYKKLTSPTSIRVLSLLPCP